MLLITAIASKNLWFFQILRNILIYHAKRELFNIQHEMKNRSCEITQTKWQQVLNARMLLIWS